MHDGDYPNVIGLFDEDDRVRKIMAEVSAGGWVKSAEADGIGAGFLKQTFHLVVKTHTEFGRNLRIIEDGPGKFFVGFRMKRDFHRPAILRARASDSSRETPLTLPDSISAMRRSISVFQA